MVFNKIRIFRLKKKVKNNPYIGTKESNGTYIYRQDVYTIKYEILNIQTPKPLVKIISIKHRLTESEIARKRMGELFRDIFRYQRWVYLFRPPPLLLLIVGIAILYFGIIEPYQNKVDRFRWIVAKAIGVEPARVEYKGGLLTILSKRDTVYKKEVEDYEHISFTFSPLNIFSSKTLGYVTRWNKDAGYITNPISYDEAGNVWIRYKDTWEHGIIAGNEVKWDKSLGTVRWPISGHRPSTEDKDLRIIDQK